MSRLIISHRGVPHAGPTLEFLSQPKLYADTAPGHPVRDRVMWAVMGGSITFIILFCMGAVNG